VALADRSILLDDGRVVAVGSHRDLLEREPRDGAVMSSGSSSSQIPAAPRR
jgi:ABC-type multidrug transport system fused ATPase/permease subunit